MKRADQAILAAQYVERIKAQLDRGYDSHLGSDLYDLQCSLRGVLWDEHESNYFGYGVAVGLFVLLQVSWFQLPLSQYWIGNGGILHLASVMLSIGASAWAGDLVVRDRRNVRLAAYHKWLNATYDPKKIR